MSSPPGSDNGPLPPAPQLNSYTWAKYMHRGIKGRPLVPGCTLKIWIICKAEEGTTSFDQKFIKSHVPLILPSPYGSIESLHKRSFCTPFRPVASCFGVVWPCTTEAVKQPIVSARAARNFF